MMLKRVIKPLIVAGSFAFIASGADAAAFYSIVTPSDLGGWSDESVGNVSVEFVEGPGTTPFATSGSLKFEIGKKAEKEGGIAELRLGSGWHNLPLQDLSIRYYT